MLRPSRRSEKVRSMNAKVLGTLEFPKVLARLAEVTAFSASRELALALEPSADRFWVERRQEETAEAVRLLQQAVQASPGNAQAHYYLGRALEDAAQPEKAIKEMQIAVKFQPGMVEAQTQLGKMLKCVKSKAPWRHFGRR